DIFRRKSKLLRGGHPPHANVVWILAGEVEHPSAFNFQLAELKALADQQGHPSSVRLLRGCARRRLTEDLIRLQHLRPPGRRQAGDEAEPMGSAAPRTGSRRR